MQKRNLALPRCRPLYTCDAAATTTVDILQASFFLYILHVHNFNPAFFQFILIFLYIKILLIVILV
jgi:hypothetical protein